jgi:hypothetical protein
MVASITRIQSPFNILLNQILIFNVIPKYFELYHIFKGSVSYFYITILSSILVTSQQYILSFLCVTSKSTSLLSLFRKVEKQLRQSISLF